MSGYSKIYCIGGLGGFHGADGINPIHFQIWVGDADRQWLEVHYVDRLIKPLGRIKSIIPEGPNDPAGLLDACIAFYPKHFSKCSSLKVIREKTSGFESLDFHLGKKKIPKEWYALRGEALPFFKTLNIFEGELRPVAICGYENIITR
jgi:hypothetical protein